MGSLVSGETVGTDKTPEEIAQQLHLTPEQIRWRKEMINFTTEDSERLGEMEDLVETEMDRLVDGFLGEILAHDRTMEIVERSPRTVEELEQIVNMYYQTFVGGEYDRSYYKHRTRIGRLHDRLNMPLYYFDGMFANIGTTFTELLCEQTISAATAQLDSEETAAVSEAIEDGFRDVQAVIRGLNLDMQIVNDTYMQSYADSVNEHIEQTDETAQTVQQKIEAATESSDEIDEIAEAVADAVTEQSQDLDEMSTEIADLSAVIEEIASTSDEVSDVAGNATATAENGLDATRDANEQVEEVVEAHEELSDHMETLVGDIAEVNSIVNGIHEIADQTNMLALNASIEAARAGEAGEGFAVVADEVKNLAEETQEQAEEVESIVTEITNQIETAAAALSRAGSDVEETSDQIETAEQSLLAVVEAFAEVRTGVSDLSAATDEQARTAQEVASSIDDISAEASTLEEQSNAIKEGITAQHNYLKDISQEINSMATQISNVDTDKTVTEPGDGVVLNTTTVSGERLRQD